MSASGITEEVIEEIRKGSFNFGIMNFANPDMVGHTGVMEAAVSAVEEVDRCLGLVLDNCLKNGFQVFVTADHGNAEYMWNYEKNIPFTAHTTNPVYFIHAGRNIKKSMVLREGHGSLADIAPTILKQMGIPIPKVFSGIPFT
jgi:2,3-bisphosphoglycerate-independent phosphoglycerate mutase